MRPITCKMNNFRGAWIGVSHRFGAPKPLITAETIKKATQLQIVACLLLGQGDV